MIIISLLLLIMFSSLYSSSEYFNIQLNRLGVLVLLICIILNIDMSMLQYIEYYSSGLSIYNDFFSVSALTKTIEALILIISILLTINSSTKLTGIYKLDHIQTGSKDYILIILFNCIGLLLLPLTNNLISLFIIIELQSYSLYILTSIHNTSNYSTKAGLIYFLLGGLASASILLGTSIIYYVCGDLSFDHIYAFILGNINNNYELVLGYIFILSGLLLKMGLAPFHN